MKKLISSQRFGMIAEICDTIALECVEAALKKGLTQRDSVMFALKIRLEWESDLSMASDETIIATYEKFVCDR